MQIVRFFCTQILRSLPLKCLSIYIMQESEISFVHIKAQNDYMLKATKKNKSLLKNCRGYSEAADIYKM